MRSGSETVTTTHKHKSVQSKVLSLDQKCESHRGETGPLFRQPRTASWLQSSGRDTERINLRLKGFPVSLGSDQSIAVRAEKANQEKTTIPVYVLSVSMFGHLCKPASRRQNFSTRFHKPTEVRRCGIALIFTQDPLL